MKYLILLLLALLVLWKLRSKMQAPDSPDSGVKTAPASKAVEMYACAHCGLHMPLNEMVTGTRGSYCSSGHRSLAEN